MLLQSQGGEINLLPALPQPWVEGKVSGLRARGGFEVDITWQDGKLTEAVVRSRAGQPCHLRWQDRTCEVKIAVGESFRWTGQ
jgi:alpha-L-fucosidase 2